MTDERRTFEQTHTRLEEILVQVRKKDTSLEQSLELLEEGVRLANLCNELIDKSSWEAPRAAEESDSEGGAAVEAVPDAAEAEEVRATDADVDDGVVTAEAVPAEVVPDDERS
jgi:exodeoxyribonuclease VII small subunit